MNRGALGWPARPSTISRVALLTADDASLGTAPIARIGGVSAAQDRLGVPHLVASITHVPSIVSMAYVSSADRVVAASSSASGQCYVFHPARHEIVARFRVGGPAARVLVDPTTGYVLVARTDGGLAFVDPSTWRVIRVLATGASAVKGAVAAERRGSVVLHGAAGGVEVNTVTRALTPFVLTIDALASLYHPDRDDFWVQDATVTTTLKLYGPASMTLVESTITLPAAFVGMTLASDGTVYVLMAGGLVKSYTTDNLDSLSGGGSCTAIAEQPRTRRLYVGMTGIGGVTVVNGPQFVTTRNSQQRCVLPCGAPTSMVACPSTGLMYAAASTSSTIAILT